MSTDNNDFIARNQNDIPGLSLLFRPRELARHLAGHYGIDPQELLLVARYVRFKPGSSCLVGYHAKWRGQAFTCTAKALAPHNAVKFDKLRRRVILPGPLGAGRLLLPEHLLAIWFFPNDKALRGLRHYLGRHPDIRVLAYKPERRFVGRLDRDDGSAEVVKLYKSAAFARARRLAEIGHGIAFLPNLAHVNAKRRAIHLDWAEGEILTHAVVLGDGRPGCEAAGSIIARLHAHPVPTGLECVDAEEQVGRLRALTDDVIALCPEGRADAERIQQGLRSALLAMPAPTVLVHGDFYANQVLLCAEGPRLLDVDALTCGHAESDVGLFLAHLRFDVLRRRLTPGDCEALGQGFVAAYRARRGLDERRLQVFTLLGMYQLAHRPFRDQLPAWPTLILQWLGEIASGVGGLQPPAALSTSAASTELDAIRSRSAKNLVAAALDPGIGHGLVEGALHGLESPYARVRVTDAAAIRHRPGRRALVRYELRPQDKGPVIEVVGKIREKGLDRQTFALNRRLHAIASAEPDQPLRVPRPLAMVPGLSMWLQDWVTGNDGWWALDDAHERHHAEAIATALHQMHHCDAPTQRRHTPDDEFAILRQRLTAAAVTCPGLESRLQRLATGCHDLAATLGPRPVRVAHRDFYPDQLVLSGCKVYLLDLDLACHADPALDLGNYLAHVQERDLRLHGDPRKHSAFCARLVATYGALAGDAGLDGAVDAYRVLSLARLVDISTRFDQRKAFTDEILGFCERELADLLSTRTTRHFFNG